MSHAAGSPATLVRRYRGTDEADAVATFELDADDLARQGYCPVSQSWAPSPWSGGVRLVAVLLMLIVRPVGTLTVTYSFREARPGPGRPSPGAGRTAR
jgi:hypothetical protein